MRRTAAPLRTALLCWSVLGAGAQDFSEIQVERVATGFHFTEGPVWSREGFLLFSDTANNRILKYVPGEQATAVYRESTNGASGAAFDSQGRYYICETRGRRVVRIDRKGVSHTLAETWEGQPLNAPNDITVRKDFHAYFTDPAFGSQSDTRKLDFYGVYHITPGGELSLVAKPAGRPNGIALSPGGRVLYVANSDDHAVYAHDLDRNGQASGQRKLIAGILGVPGGLRADEKGNLYVAAAGIQVYSPEGKWLGSINTPETPANCAFGDPDLRTLYITARTSLYRVRLDVKGATQY